MSERLKVGLIGAGVFAGYHAHKLAAHPRVNFTAVVDSHAERATKLADIHGIQALPLGQMLAMSDAVVIASAATTHGSLAIQALKAGCHCLIEKPLATTVAQAEEITTLAAAQGLTVQVGHQERMVLRAIGLEDLEDRPLKIEAVRNSTYSVRGTDTSVTFDLMSHDIDLCTLLMGGAADVVNGQSGAVRSATADMADARLRFGDAAAHLTASRVAEKSERWMKLTYPTGEVRIDFNAKTLSNSTAFALDTNFAHNEMAKDCLGAATDVFVRAILDGTPVLVSAEDGAIAVRTAAKIDAEM